MEYRSDISSMKEFSVYTGECYAKLDQNESPFSLPDPIVTQMAHVAMTMQSNRYVPVKEFERLKKRIASYCGVSEEMIAVGAGADSFIHTLIELWTVGKGDVVTLTPSYPAYGIFSTVNGARLVTSPLTHDTFDVDEKDVREKLSSASLMFITYPNNPTGNYYKRSVIESLVRDYPAVMFVIDEAYYEYGDDTFASEVASYENLTVIRTFSKYFSVPSLRLGYCIAQPKHRQLIERCQFMPYNVSLFSLLAGHVLLDNETYFHEKLLFVRSERERISAKLKDLPNVRVYPSKTNFIFIHSNDSHADELAQQGIFTRNFGFIPYLAGFFRVTIGNESENDAFLKAMEVTCSCV